jgi:2'-5' RNA ligase
VKQTIQQIQGHLEPLGCDIAWVKPGNAHLTLKFLGDVKMGMIPSLTETLDDLCRNLNPIETRLTQPGVFPDFWHPRVVWIGLDDSDGNLTRLSGSLDTALGNIGFKKERRDFKPHITIGRIRMLKNIQQLSDAIKKFSVPADIKQSIGQIILVKSTLTPQGSIYEPLSHIDFG